MFGRIAVGLTFSTPGARCAAQAVREREARVDGVLHDADRARHPHRATGGLGPAPGRLHPTGAVRCGRAARFVRDHRAAPRGSQRRSSLRLGVIVIQAQGAAAAQGRGPELTRTALAAITDVGRGALAEMRMLLSTDARVDPAERAPLRGVRDVPALVQQLRDTGTVVDLDLPPVEHSLIEIARSNYARTASSVGRNGRRSLRDIDGSRADRTNGGWSFTLRSRARTDELPAAS